MPTDRSAPTCAKGCRSRPNLAITGEDTCALKAHDAFEIGAVVHRDALTDTLSHVPLVAKSLERFGGCVAHPRREAVGTRLDSKICGWSPALYVAHRRCVLKHTSHWNVFRDHPVSICTLNGASNILRQTGASMSG